MPESYYIAHPDVVTAAIKFLCATVFTTGGALIGTLLYIWHKTDGRIATMEVTMGRMATSLEELKTNTATELAGVNGDIKAMKQLCDERHPRKEGK